MQYLQFLFCIDEKTSESWARIVLCELKDSHTRLRVAHFFWFTFSSSLYFLLKINLRLGTAAMKRTVLPIEAPLRSDYGTIDRRWRTATRQPAVTSGINSIVPWKSTSSGGNTIPEFDDPSRETRAPLLMQLYQPEKMRKVWC